MVLSHLNLNILPACLQNTYIMPKRTRSTTPSDATTQSKKAKKSEEISHEETPSLVGQSIVPGGVLIYSEDSANTLTLNHTNLKTALAAHGAKVQSSANSATTIFLKGDTVRERARRGRDTWANSKKKDNIETELAIQASGTRKKQIMEMTFANFIKTYSLEKTLFAHASVWRTTSRRGSIFLSKCGTKRKTLVQKTLIRDN